MKTKFALAFYYITISFLVACAATIVVKLIFWPPCTQIGNTCAIDPWSTAGLAGTVLAVSATVLAILGAVAVAAWWTSLNDRVNDQVKKLYAEQKAEVDSRVDLILKEQREKVDTQLEDIKEKFVDFISKNDHLIKQLNEILHRSKETEAQSESMRESLNEMRAGLIEDKERIESLAARQEKALANLNEVTNKVVEATNKVVNLNQSDDNLQKLSEEIPTPDSNNHADS